MKNPQMKSEKYLKVPILKIKYYVLPIMFVLLLSCNDSNKRAIPQKKQPFAIDSVNVVQIFGGRMDLQFKGFGAYCKSYLLGDSVGRVLIAKLSKDSVYQDFRRVSVNLNHKKSQKLSYVEVNNKQVLDKILVEFYCFSPDLEMVNVEFKSPNTLIIRPSGCILSKQIKNRHYANTMCRVLCVIQIPEKLKKWNIYYEPYPIDEDYIYQPIGKPWAWTDGKVITD